MNKSYLKTVKAYKAKQEVLRAKAINKGTNLIAPETIYLSSDTKFGKNITIEPFVVIGSKVKIGDNSLIKSFTHIEGAKIEKNVIIGPYSRIRPGTVLKMNTKIGNFVETKKSSIDKNSKVNHLSYIGDTIIGKNTNYFKKQLQNKVSFHISKNLKNSVIKILKDIKSFKRKNNTILLSPASASFDQYLNFEERGRAFKKFCKYYARKYL